jgi:hypothetical protein
MNLRRFSRIREFSDELFVFSDFLVQRIPVLVIVRKRIVNLLQPQVRMRVNYFVRRAVKILVLYGYVYYSYAGSSNDRAAAADFRVDFDVRMFCFCFLQGDARCFFWYCYVFQKLLTVVVLVRRTI